jgi:pimeloyl-ACP methyl ester carboxylesterase
MHARSAPVPARVRVAPASRVARREGARATRTCVSAGAAAESRPAVVVLPGLGNQTEDYDAFASELEGRGFSVTVARVARPDWLRNAAGLADLNYWKGTLQPRPTVDWYLERIDDAIARAKETSGAARVSLVAHSAGGWMARVYLEDFGTESVHQLVSLGSPLNSVPKDVPGVVDQTRGILTYVESRCASAADLAARGVAVTCLAGKWLEGAESLDGFGNAANFFVGQGYKQVCGSSGAWGDGITPVATAHLPGAENVTLEGVFHTPLGSSESRPWYGTPAVLDEWVEKLMT